MKTPRARESTARLLGMQSRIGFQSGDRAHAAPAMYTAGALPRLCALPRAAVDSGAAQMQVTSQPSQDNGCAAGARRRPSPNTATPSKPSTYLGPIQGPTHAPIHGPVQHTAAQSGCPPHATRDPGGAKHAGSIGSSRAQQRTRPAARLRRCWSLRQPHRDTGRTNSSHVDNIPAMGQR